MKTYQAPDGSLHELSDEDISNGGLLLLPIGCVEISKAQADAIRAANQPVVVPESVSMRQARIELFNAGLLSNVDAAIASFAEPQQTIAKISWDYSSTVERNNPVFIQLATALGLNSAQIDQFMINASKL